MDFKRVNNILKNDLLSNINNLIDILQFKEKLNYINIITGNALFSDDIFHLANNLTSSVMATKINNIMKSGLEREQLKINKMNIFIDKLSIGQSTNEDYINYIKEKYRVGKYSYKKAEKIYELEIKLSNGSINLTEFETLNKLKGMSDIERKIIKEDFLMNKESSSIINSSIILSYKESIKKKLNSGSLLSSNEFKTLLELEGIHVSTVNKIFKISKAYKTIPHLEVLTSAQLESLEVKFQKDAIDILKNQNKIN